ncbi:hypothetical protein PITCH_A50036 [uncultured Desulfobacterium sp.]|uniref:Uncharacterized protein n=1 Tax=uncultured Desulfobacterium sp. TaxID=201089 RepID=A0A445N0H4_9BACT|nr:hypothetical protein PITCH_A50036 [uncultured Desulfobacterium sp.]
MKKRWGGTSHARAGAGKSTKSVAGLRREGGLRIASYESRVTSCEAVDDGFSKYCYGEGLQGLSCCCGS